MRASSPGVAASLPLAHCVPFQRNENVLVVPVAEVAFALKKPATVPTVVSFVLSATVSAIFTPGTVILSQELSPSVTPDACTAALSLA